MLFLFLLLIAINTILNYFFLQKLLLDFINFIHFIF